MILRIVFTHRAFDHHARVIALRQRQIKPGQNFTDRPAGQSLAFTQEHDVVCQTRDFILRVADIQHRYIQLGMQTLKVGQDLGLALAVECSERLVHQQQFRAGQQGAGNTDPLTLATRQVIGGTFQQMSDAEQVSRVGQFYPACLARDTAQAEFKVGAHREVREQAGLLKDIPQ